MPISAICGALIQRQRQQRGLTKAAPATGASSPSRCARWSARTRRQYDLFLRSSYRRHVPALYRSNSAGVLLDEAERNAGSRAQLAHHHDHPAGGKLTYNTLLAFVQLTSCSYGLGGLQAQSLYPYSGFLIMGLCTAFAVAAFGMLLASICGTRAQLGALSTLVILIMSSVGGSMFPLHDARAMQKAACSPSMPGPSTAYQSLLARSSCPTALAAGCVLWPSASCSLVARRIARRWGC